MESNINHPFPIDTEVFTYAGKAKILSSVSVGDGTWQYVIDNNFMELSVNSKNVFLTLEDFKRAERISLGIRKIGDNVHQATKEMVNHPAHYGGDNPLEVIKIIDHYKLGFALGNCIKYTIRADKKGNKLEDLKKAAWYLQHEINKLENI